MDEALLEETLAKVWLEVLDTVPARGEGKARDKLHIPGTRDLGERFARELGYLGFKVVPADPA